MARLTIPRISYNCSTSFDWTDVGDFHTLVAAACIGGRAVPLV